MDGLIIAGVAIVAIAFIGIAFTKLYKRASKERSFVRTGLGGEKVIIDGGAIILPIFHEVKEINMSTIKLEVSKNKQEGLITKDKLRIDVSAEFYIAVELTKEAISKAAQTLGGKTLVPAELKILIEGKLVDALRSVAAKMDMFELHEKRSEFVQQVQSTIAEDLTKNGLKLESVSLTKLDQTDISIFNKDNMFDSEGLKKLSESIQANKKRINDIEKTAELEIKTKNQEIEREKLLIDQEANKNRMEQKQQIEKDNADKEAEIEANKIQKNKETRTLEIEANKDLELKEIQKNKELENAKIENEKIIKGSLIEKEKFLKLAEQNKVIEISKKTQEELKAKTLENEEKAKELTSSQKMITAEETEKATREKALFMINISKETETETQKATARAEAIKTEAEAIKLKMETEANGKRAMIDAENSISEKMIEMKLKLALMENLDKIVAQIVKPMENIDSIKIIQANGIMNNGSSSTGTCSSETSLPNQVVDAALKYKVSLPFLQEMIKEVGIDLSSTEGLLAGIAPVKAIKEETIVEPQNSIEELTNTEVK